MKYSNILRIGIFITISFILSNLYAQHWDHRLYAVHSTDSLDAWVVGSNGTILHTQNGGINWIDKSTNALTNFNTICFSDSLNGFIGGETTVLRTTDGGQNWFDIGFSNYVKSIRFVDGNHGWIGLAGYPPAGFYRTSNGGDDWSFSEKQLLDISFVDPMNGWGVIYDSGYLHTIEKTEDGGISWIPIFTIDPYGGASEFHLWFLDTLNGIYSDKGLQGWGYNFKTSNGGNIWQNFGSGLEGQLRNISAVNISNIWMVTSDSHIWYTDNFFVTSSSFDLVPNVDYVMDVSVNGYSNGWAVGWSDYDKGSVWKLENINDWNLVGIAVGNNEISNSGQELKVYPNPFQQVLKIHFQQKEMGLIDLSVYNNIGVEIETFIDVVSGAGDYQVIWNSKSLPSGIYYIVLQTAESMLFRKIIKL